MLLLGSPPEGDRRLWLASCVNAQSYTGTGKLAITFQNQAADYRAAQVRLAW